MRAMRSAHSPVALRWLCAAFAVCIPAWAGAQAATGGDATAWQACTQLADTGERLACFDRWAASQRAPATAAMPPAPAAAPAAAPPAPSPAAIAAPVPTPARGEPPSPEMAAAVATARTSSFSLTRKQGCRAGEHTGLSQFWELEASSDCGTFGLRGFRPSSVSVATGDTVNSQPTSANPLNNVTTPQPYRIHEMRLQLSVRSKIATGLLTTRDAEASDSLWFAYTQQSYWQLFTPGISRPFRSTDHEPEVIYIYPLQSADPGRWRLRYGGLGLVHQSNGQSLPLSRSWNRVYLMAGAERGGLMLQGRMWRRLSERETGDDNPGIGETIGRAELLAGWRWNRANLAQVTLRHNLHTSGRGSVRLEWFRTLAGDDQYGAPAGLQMHLQLFSGYGDSLLDYNRRRTMFSVGFSLTDW